MSPASGQQGQPWGYRGAATAPGTEPTARAVVPAVVRAVVVVVVFAVVGVVAGYVWHQLWTAPMGEAIQGTWYPVRGTTLQDVSTNESSLGDMFDATGLFMVVTFVGGLALGLLAALLVRRAELVVLVAVVVGSALATFLCAKVGLHLSPPDPAVVAASAADFTPVPGNMTLSGHSPYVFWAFGAVLGLGGVYLLTSSSTHQVQAQPGPYGSTPPPWLGPEQTG